MANSKSGRGFLGFLFRIFVFLFVISYVANALDISYQEPTGLTVGDIQISLEAQPQVKNIYIGDLPYGVDRSYSNTIREAQTYWEKRLDISFKEVATQQEADITILWVKEFGGKTLGHTIYSDFIEIGLGDSYCHQRWQAYNYDTIFHLAKHELGHTLGYADDYENKNNIMYYSVNTQYEMDMEETDILPDGYTRWYGVCTDNPVALYQIELVSNEPVNVAFFPSESDVKSALNDKEHNVYSNCFKQDVTYTKFSCTISSESFIAIKNPTTFGLGSAAQFTIKLKEL